MAKIESQPAHSKKIPPENLPVTTLKGVGDKLALTLEKLGLKTLQDLLFHLPIRYLDRTRITPIGHLQTNTSVMIQGNVLRAQVTFGRKRSLVVHVEDNTGVTCLRFYHFSGYQKDKFQPGALVRGYGEPRLGSSGLEFYHPEYEFIDERNPEPVDQTLTPIYGLTDGISQQRMRGIVEQAVAVINQSPPDEYLPVGINDEFGCESLSQALTYVHQPPKGAPVPALLEGLHPSQQRLAFEELLAHFLARRKIHELAAIEQAPVLKLDAALKTQFLQQLSFQLTAAQQRVVAEIQTDLVAGKPMLRMVQGDVGSGKTLVAALTALAGAGCGYQVAVVAPTEILAEQHFHNFSGWLEHLGFTVEWLVGKLTVAKRRDALTRIASGEARVVVGTHALFQDDVEFHSLGLAIIDEQHRFGVHQRLSLRQKSRPNAIAHQLVMTATPIPRTLAMTAYAELDYSIIDELPPGRTPVNTVLVSQSRRAQVIERIRVASGEGRQVYWVCTLVEDSETLAAANAEETAVLLREALPNLAIGLVHGRLKAKEKEAVMAGFKQAELQLLVATTVIEVGVDVPNASLMIIENPERLGLAQLHQLRGRVGRGSVASHCVLLYGAKLSEQARERLQVLRETNDGFVVAERDLQQRGPGELLGTRQTGEAQYRVANLLRDEHLIERVNALGEQLLGSQPGITEKLVKRWVGERKVYAQV
ncbi:ATP-dependent DNA helicase RecG [Teredinibacter franksiae]|uniref:ATP-dependent DNA helicase RecG n=1 Tax=Teredinibacter franksiae TaxID=2761453 RepID=UPI0028B0DA3A|nr:ATP-dependent DNA helicase RecG [Teredinibacter franksiae]